MPPPTVPTHTINSSSNLQATIIFEGVLTRVIFDTGASHSYIAFGFIQHLGLVPIKSRHPRRVNTAGGQITVPCLTCLNCSLTIKNYNFTCNVDALNITYINVILGMDWLALYNGVINCVSRVISVQPRRGTHLYFNTNGPPPVLPLPSESEEESEDDPEEDPDYEESEEELDDDYMLF